MLLIIPGNPNLENIRNVVYFANMHYDRKITHILFIDTKSSIMKEDKSIEGERNIFVRKYIPKAIIETSLNTKEELHIEIPRILSEKLLLFSESDIVVDLTNGNKYVSNILYASASLSKITQLFFLFVSIGKQNEPPELLKNDDYSIEVISALENLESIGKYTYFEITYYRETTDQLLADFGNTDFKSSFLKNMLNLQIRDAVTKYFSENYPDAISCLGQVIEEIAIELCQAIKNEAKGEIKAKDPKSFDESISWLRSNFCDPLRGKRNRELNEYEERLKVLQNADKIIDTIKVYRNLSSHGGYEILRGREEARLILNITIYLLNIIKNTGVFS